MIEKKAKNAEKQKRFRERQKEQGKKEVRGYLSPEALICYEELRKQTNWTDNDLVGNAMKITYAAYKCGQIGLLNKWLTSKEL